METFDVAIVGAGPAGSSSAIGLAGRGYSVALLDRKRFPREKLCGDFLNPVSWPLLRQLQVASEVLARPHEKIRTFRFTSLSGAEIEIPLPVSGDEGTAGLGLRRFDLDQVLVERARSLGVTVLEGCKPEKIERKPRGWRLRLHGSDDFAAVDAKLLIGADGRNSWVAHRLGLAVAPAMQGGAAGFQFRLKRVHHAKGKVEIHLFPGGYAGVVWVDDQTVTLGLAIQKDRLLDGRSEELLLQSTLPQNPWLKKIIRSGQVSEFRSTYPVYFPPRRPYADGLLLVGDAARVSEPVTGEGIYFALKSGAFAANTVDTAFQSGDLSAARLRSYARDCSSAFRTRRGVNALIRWLIHRPALLEPLIRVSGKQPGLLGSLVQTICQPS
jgi:geranylgeranyl reductase family protein